MAIWQKLSKRHKTALVAVSASVAILIAVLGFSYVWQKRVEGWDLYRPLPETPSQVDVVATQDFLSPSASRQQRFDTLFRYFLWGAQNHLSRDGALLHYRGLPSYSYHMSGLEGFARTAPLFAAWVASGRPRSVPPLDGSQPIDLVEWLARGLATGTNPDAAEYWGDIGDDDQRIVEAADVALVLWIGRREIWPALSQDEQSQLIKWLRQTETAQISHRNNWILYPVVVSGVLKAMHLPHGPVRPNYFEFRKNHIEHGWFRDGPEGDVDYYNTWAISYSLFWINQLVPNLDPDFIDQVLPQSGDLTRHLISPRGIPIFGRSVCYRTAIPAAVIAASQVEESPVTAQQAARALDSTWSYFIRNGILRDGTMTMGYLNTDPRLVDNYSGPGSCHWGLRSLVLAYLYPERSSFWTGEPALLPVEEKSYEIDLQRIGWKIEGKHETGDIVVTFAEGKNRLKEPPVEEISRWSLWKSAIFHRPFRPQNLAAKYQAANYSAIRPFFMPAD